MGRNRTHDTTTRTETGTAPMAIDPRIVTISNTHMSHPMGMPTCPTSSALRRLPRVSPTCSTWSRVRNPTPTSASRRYAFHSGQFTQSQVWRQSRTIYTNHVASAFDQGKIYGDSKPTPIDAINDTVSADNSQWGSSQTPVKEPRTNLSAAHLPPELEWQIPVRKAWALSKGSHDNLQPRRPLLSDQQRPNSVMGRSEPS
ncbi:MAG: hypothetical protein K0Q46_3682 [Rhodococcus erythropolis]|nr:hypothetical protein [Rhodococcus erythropolis]